MNVLSLFSGVGGFDLGLEAAGMHTVALCEIDKNCRKVLRRHWPDTPIYEDVSTLTATQLLADGVTPDLVAFGSPCQDLSVAGKRAGLAGARSGLFGEALRIIRELKEATHGTYPTWAIWENVPGALNSTGGDDFAAVLDSMADAGAVAIEWAVLDAQNFGVPQRRRRIFLVACFDPRAGEFCPEPLLPVGEGSPRDLATRRTAWKESSRQAQARVGARGESDSGVTVVSALTANGVGTCGADDNQAQAGHLLPVEQDPTASTWWDGGDVAETLTRTSNEQRMPDKNRLQVVVQDDPVIMRQREGKPGGGKGPLLSDVSLTLATGNDQYLFQPNDTTYSFDSTFGNQSTVSEDLAPTIKVGSGLGIASPPAVTAVVEPVNFDEFNFTGDTDTHHALRAGTPQSTGVAQPEGPQLAVRRLTPLECERLMGWPEDHTRWADDGTEMRDSHRYKMCGNGIASPVAEWVGRHVLLAQAYLNTVPEAGQA